MIRIGDRIRARREKLGWTITKLATVAEIHPSTISRVEKGLRGLKESDLFKVAGAMGMSVDKLYAPQGNVEDAPPDYRTIPVLDYIQAGHWMKVQGTMSDGDIRETISTNLDYPPSVFALRIRGDSMQPEFRPGDIVVIAPTVSPQPGDYVVASDETGDATFKKYRDAGQAENGTTVFELIALNPDYGPMRSDRMKIAIVGTMIEHRRYRHR